MYVCVCGVCMCVRARCAKLRPPAEQLFHSAKTGQIVKSSSRLDIFVLAGSAQEASCVDAASRDLFWRRRARHPWCEHIAGTAVLVWLLCSDARVRRVSAQTCVLVLNNCPASLRRFFPQSEALYPSCLATVSAVLRLGSHWRSYESTRAVLLRTRQLPMTRLGSRCLSHPV